MRDMYKYDSYQPEGWDVFKAVPPMFVRTRYRPEPYQVEYCGSKRQLLLFRFVCDGLVNGNRDATRSYSMDEIEVLDVISIDYIIEMFISVNTVG